MGPRKRKVPAQSGGKPKKRPRLTLVPKDRDAIPPSDASTLPVEADESGDITGMVREEGGKVISDTESLTDLEDDDAPYRETDPMRDDRPVVTTRWDKPEVDALMVAVNVNRDAIKFHFQGPGGGKDVKRKGWKEVARYVNDTADTHRTVKQCRTKAADYSQNAKDKYNKLRFQVCQTGRGKISKKLHLDLTQMKALDYLRREAVKGVVGIQEADLGEKKVKKPSRKNIKLLWEPDRPTKPDYSNVKMERSEIPKNYKEKNKRRVGREAKLKRRKEHLSMMRKERKKDRAKARALKEDRKAKKKEGRIEKERKKKRAQKRKVNEEKNEENKGSKDRKAERKARKAERQARKARKADRQARKERNAKRKARKERKAETKARKERKVQRQERQSGQKN